MSVRGRLPLQNSIDSWLSRRDSGELALLAGVSFLLASIALAGAQFVGDIWAAAVAILLGLAVAALAAILLRYAWRADTRPGLERWILPGLLVAGLLFQIGRWYVEGGGISARTGDDDEIYIFIGQQIAGFIQGPPLFTIRPPGVPLLVAGSLAGGGALTGAPILWPLSLIQRLMLAMTPGLLYLVLRDWLPRPFAALAGLLYLATPIHESKAGFALSELPYTFGTLVTIAGLWLTVRGGPRRRVWLLAIASLALVFKTALRLTGVGAALAMAIALVVMTADWKWRRRLGGAALLALPSVLLIVALTAYNARTTGQATVSELGGLNVIRHFAPRLDAIADSPETEYFAGLAPEVDRSELFSAAGLWTTARYRAALNGEESLRTFTAMSASLSSQIVRSHPGAYAVWILQKFYTDMMYPRVETIPIIWYRPELTNLLVQGAFDPPISICKADWTAAVSLVNVACELDESARSATVFEPDLPSLPGVVREAIHFLTISLVFRLRLIGWVFYWGIAGLISVLLLVIRRDTRQVGWLLGAAFGAEFLPLMIVAPVSTQYQILYHPVYALAIWIALGSLMRRAS